MKGMKVQKGWKDENHTIPKYIFIKDIDILFTNDNSIFYYKKDIKIKKNELGYWSFEDKNHGYIIDGNAIYWLNDRPFVMYINSKVKI